MTILDLQSFRCMHNHMPKKWQRANKTCNYPTPVFFTCRCLQKQKIDETKFQTFAITLFKNITEFLVLIIDLYRPNSYTSVLSDPNVIKGNTRLTNMLHNSKDMSQKKVTLFVFYFNLVIR